MKMGRGLQKPLESVSVLEQPGALTRRFSDKNATCRWRKGGRGGWSACMQKKIKLMTSATCKHWLKLKKIYKSQTKHQLNSDRTIEFLTIKTSKQDPTWLYFDKLFIHIFLITVIYFVIARTKRMKCQNKREQLSKQVYTSPRTTNVVSEQGSDICYYYRHNKILL
jgi:hypothetical protein